MMAVLAGVPFCTSILIWWSRGCEQTLRIQMVEEDNTFRFQSTI